jgi:hypothetical protein
MATDWLTRKACGAPGHASCLIRGMRPRTFVSLLGCVGLLMVSSCGETSSSSPEGAGSPSAGVAGAGAGAAGKGVGGAGGSDSAGRGGAGGGSAGTVFDPCKGVPPPQYKCVPAEQAWEWSRTSADPAPLPEAGGAGGIGNGGAGGEAGSPAVTFPPGTCPSIQSISEQLPPNAASFGFTAGTFTNGQCCYTWGAACG